MTKTIKKKDNDIYKEFNKDVPSIFCKYKAPQCGKSENQKMAKNGKL